MKLISWNIDSLNAALTSDSARAKLSQDVLQTLVAEDADIIVKAMLEPCSSIRKN